jgi:hypothetical protein
MLQNGKNCPTNQKSKRKANKKMIYDYSFPLLHSLIVSCGPKKKEKMLISYGNR